MFKPFTSIDGQIALLQRRGVQTDKQTPVLLAREGYYAIVNGYKDPFLDAEASRKAGDDRYLSWTSFNGIYSLFLFDRKLRFLCLRTLTVAETLLRTACAYCFSASHRDETNAYLNPANYSDDPSKGGDVAYVISQLEKILHKSKTPPAHGGKEYLYHCTVAYDGEIPLWVMANDMMMGQVTSLFRAMTREDRGAVARYLEGLYNASHKHPITIEPHRIDSAYRRIKDFRNICAHDERLYCARPYGENNSFAQLVQDLRFVTTRVDYVEFLRQLRSLMSSIGMKLPRQASAVFSRMGFPNGISDVDACIDKATRL